MDEHERGTTSRRAFLGTTAGVAAGAGLAGASGETIERRVVGVETAAAAAAVRRRAHRVERTMSFGEYGLAVVGEFSTTARVEVQGHRAVRYVETDVDVELLGDPAGASVAADLERQVTPWGVERTGAAAVHADGRTGAGADVAIVDTGIDSDHPDLRANLGTGRAVVENDEGRRDWDDDHDHGTHCAGIAAAAANDRGVVGVCPGATLHAVKVISADGGGSASDIAEGIRWTADQGYDVASLSLGSTVPSEVMHDAVRYAVDQGVLVVGAAGNENPEEDEVHYPAAYPEAIAVGATDDDDDLAEFSITGDAVDVAAPGVEIPSTTIGDYRYFSGTSMATPHVSGAVGLLAAAGVTGRRARERVLATAEDVGLDDDESGNGLLDVEAALANTGGGGGDDGGLSVSTRPAEAVGETTATLAGAVTDLGEAATATAEFEFWVAGERADTETTVAAGEVSAPGEFAATVDGLATDTTYVVRARASADGETVTGREVDFTTVAAPTDVVSVETGGVGDVDDDEAELRARVTAIDAEEAEVAVEFWPAGEPDRARRTDADEVDEPETVEEDAEELTAGTTYRYRARAVAEGVEVYGAEREFTTTGTGGGDPTLAVETGGVEDVDDDEAELRARVTTIGGVEEAEIAVEFWPAGEPDRVRRTDTDEVDEPETVDEDAEGLAPGTTYRYRARGTAGGVEAVGTEREFTTTGGGGGDPTLAVETVGVEDVDDDEAELRGRVTTIGGVEEAEVAFEFWPADAPDRVRRTDTDDVDERDDFDEDAEELAPETDYVAVAVCWAGETEVRGDRVTFRTAAD